MARSPIAAIRQELQASRRITLQLIDPLDAETATFRPRPDAWSIKDHVAHLMAVEESVIHFAHRILDEDCPISPLCHDVAFNQDVWNNREVAERAGYTWIEARCALDAIRQELLALLDHVPIESLDRLGSHPVWGTPVTLASVLRVPYRHERRHRDEIAALAALKQTKMSSGVPT
ncbi:MAG: DinB family protein [Anaerolineae bacterium]|nr:DinB family protein [Anaerolineae bacterium]